MRYRRGVAFGTQAATMYDVAVRFMEGPSG
jgi:hypothetical protein